MRIHAAPTAIRTFSWRMVASREFGSGQGPHLEMGASKAAARLGFCEMSSTVAVSWGSHSWRSGTGTARGRGLGEEVDVALEEHRILGNGEQTSTLPTDLSHPWCHGHEEDHAGCAPEGMQTAGHLHAAIAVLGVGGLERGHLVHSVRAHSVRGL